MSSHVRFNTPRQRNLVTKVSEDMHLVESLAMVSPIPSSMNHGVWYCGVLDERARTGHDSL